MSFIDRLLGRASEPDNTFHEFPQFDEENPKQSIDEIYGWAIENAKEKIRWYRSKTPHKRLWSQGSRIIAIILVAVAIVCPLIDTGLSVCAPPENSCGINYLRLGYIAMAAAGAIVLFDKFFGLSTGWMRFMETRLNMEETLNAFYHDWAILQIRGAEERDYVQLLEKIKDFTFRIERLVLNETKAWTSEFKTSISNIDEMINKGKPDA